MYGNSSLADSPPKKKNSKIKFHIIQIMRKIAGIFFILAVFMVKVSFANIWENPGCFKVGHTRTISIPGCVEFDITTNACRGYCVSYSVPSTEDSLRINSKQTITSYGQCCNIMETEDIKVKVMCIDGPKALTFKSAVTCACYHCKKG